MAQPRAPWRQAMDAVLADGEWKHVDDVKAAGMAAVPVGIALRRVEKARQSSARQRGFDPGERKRNPSPAHVWQKGAHRVASMCITDAVRRGTYERDGDKIRLIQETN